MYKHSFRFSFDKIRLFIDSVQKIYHCREIYSLFISVWWIKMQPTYLNLQSRHCTCSTMMFLRRKGFKSFCILLKVHHFFPYFFDQGVFCVCWKWNRNSQITSTRFNNGQRKNLHIIQAVLQIYENYGTLWFLKLISLQNMRN